MATVSLNKIVDLINHQLVLQDKLSECLLKARSLSRIGSGEDLSEYNSDTLQSYFWVLSDLLQMADRVNQAAQNHLFIQQECLKNMAL